MPIIVLIVCLVGISALVVSRRQQSYPTYCPSPSLSTKTGVTTVRVTDIHVSPTAKDGANYFVVTVDGEGGKEVFIEMEGLGIAGGRVSSRCSVPGSCEIYVPNTNLSTYSSLPGGTYYIKAEYGSEVVFSKSLYFAPPRLGINRFDFTSVENAGGMQIRLRDVVYSATNTGDLPAFFGFQFTYGGTKILWHGNVDKQTLLPKSPRR